MASSGEITSTFIENTYGAYMIGVVVSVALYGVTVVQTWIYFRRSDRDPQWLKALIFMMWCLDTTHKILLVQSLYQYMVLDFGNPVAMFTPTWTFWTAILVSNALGAAARCLFSYRLWKLGKKWWIALPIALMSCCDFPVALAFVAIEAHHGSVFSNHITNSIFYFGGTCASFGDILLAVAQTSVLWKHRSGFRRTNTVVRTLVMYSVNTCILSCIVTIVDVILFGTSINKPQFAYMALYHQLGTLLFNALLATYNGRQELREIANGSDGIVTIPLSNLATATTDMFAGVDSNSSRAIQVSVNKSEHTKVDSIQSKSSVDNKTGSFV